MEKIIKDVTPFVFYLRTQAGGGYLIYPFEGWKIKILPMGPGSFILTYKIFET